MTGRIFPAGIGTNCDKAIKCFFDLTSLDMQVYKELLRNGPGTALELGERISRDRSTAYRSLTRLVDVGMARKDNRTREGGGIFHVYSSVEPTEVQSMLKDIVSDWYSDMMDVVERTSRELSG